MTEDAIPGRSVVADAGPRERRTAMAAVLLGAALASIAPHGTGIAGAVSLATAILWWLAVVAVVRSDLRHFIIPDAASAAIAGLGLVAAAAEPALDGGGAADVVAATVTALANGFAGFALFWFVAWMFRRRGRDALGFGDVKLAGASAIWLAPGEAALALELAALGALALLLAGRARGRRLRDTAVPFGAFMAPAAWLVHLYAPVLRDGFLAGRWW